MSAPCCKERGCRLIFLLWHAHVELPNIVFLLSHICNLYSSSSVSHIRFRSSPKQSICVRLLQEGFHRYLFLRQQDKCLMSDSKTRFCSRRLIVAQFCWCTKTKLPSVWSNTHRHDKHVFYNEELIVHQTCNTFHYFTQDPTNTVLVSYFPTAPKRLRASCIWLSFSFMPSTLSEFETPKLHRVALFKSSYFDSSFELS